jgi:hypothetical protein
MQNPLNLRQAITNMAESFIPITEAVVRLKANPGLTIKQEAVLINVNRIRLLGELEMQAQPEEKA